METHAEMHSPRRRQRNERDLASLAREEAAPDSVQRAWSIAYDACPAECRWTREMVEARSLEALRVYNVTSGRIGPRAYGRGCPEPLRDPLDLWFEQGAVDTDRDRADEQNRTPFTPTIEQVGLADGAAWWQHRYLVDTHYDWARIGKAGGPLRAWNTYLSAKNRRMDMGEVIKAAHASHSTFYRHVRHAGWVIAMGLMLDRVLNGDDAELPSEISQEVVESRIALPEWWWQTDLIMTESGVERDDKLKLADGLIEEHVRLGEYAGRSLSKKETRAEFKGRVTMLKRLLRERHGE